MNRNKKKDAKKRNPMSAVLRVFPQQKVASKKLYKRNPKHRNER